VREHRLLEDHQVVHLDPRDSRLGQHARGATRAAAWST
jgi:hypothetical protein